MFHTPAGKEKHLELTHHSAVILENDLHQFTRLNPESRTSALEEAMFGN